MRCAVRLIVYLTIAVTVMDPTLGLAQTGMIPIDQAVVDLDHLATGLRRVETGLRLEGEQTSLYQPDPTQAQTSGLPIPTTNRPTYYRLSPGLQAQVNRIDYLVPTRGGGLGLNIQPAVDGRFIEMISANTVFVLSPLVKRNELPAMLSPDRRIDYRIDGRIDGRLSTKNELSPTPSIDAYWRTKPHVVTEQQPLPISPQSDRIDTAQQAPIHEHR